MQGAQWSGKSQGNLLFFFKVREKSGNSVKWSGKLENLRKSGNFKIMLCSTHQNLNKQIRDDDFDSF